MQQPIVIKIGGHEIADSEFLSRLAEVIREMEIPIILVHGGGKEISAMQEQLGIEPRYVDGLRITDAQTLSVVEMVLCGTVNQRLVRYLVTAGVQAQGMSGADQGLIRAQKMSHPTIDMAHTGTVTEVRHEVLVSLLEQGVTPIISPICFGDGIAYNVNADHVAGAVAAAVNAYQVIFLTNVAGVMRNGEQLEVMTPMQVEQLIGEEIIVDGMIPKVKTALHTLNMGVPEAMITNLDGLQNNRGTVFRTR